jgi:hypothetical protein
LPASCGQLNARLPCKKSAFIGEICGQNLFSAKVGFSRFSLGNRQNLAFATNANLSSFSDKMSGA